VRTGAPRPPPGWGVVPQALQRAGGQPADRRGLPGRPGVVRPVLRRAAVTGGDRVGARRGAAAVLGARPLRGGAPRPLVAPPGARPGQLRPGRDRPGRRRRRRHRPAGPGLLRRGARLPLREPLPAGGSVGRAPAHRDPRRPGDRQRPHAHRRDARLHRRSRLRWRDPGGRAGGRARRRRHRAAGRGRPVRRRRAAGAAHPPRPARTRLRPGSTGGGRGGAQRGRRPPRRAAPSPQPTRARLRAGGDRVAPLLVRHRLGDARAALPQPLLRGRRRRRGVRRAVHRGTRGRRGLRRRGVRDPGRHRAPRTAVVGDVPARAGRGLSAVPGGPVHGAGHPGLGLRARPGVAGHQDLRRHVRADRRRRRLPRPGLLALRRDLQRRVRRCCGHRCGRAPRGRPVTRCPRRAVGRLPRHRRRLLEVDQRGARL
ncbi:MAG: hypothetical protein AVDCRST_MAG47-750, partial [uncultured Nocardioidaceae bacterium]